jgi:deazaflavin-dependent oxidoreductase (nitroreductase family)
MQHYSRFNLIIQHLAASRLGSWLLAPLLPAVDRTIAAWTGGKTTLTSLLAGVPVVSVHAIGARTGMERSFFVLPVQDPLNPLRFAAIGSNFGQRHNPGWYYNLNSHPEVTCTISGRELPFRTFEVSGEEYQHWWDEANRLYFGYALYRQRAFPRRIPIIVFEPQA